MPKRKDISSILIIGAGPTGLFTVFEAGLLKLNLILLMRYHNLVDSVQKFIQKNLFMTSLPIQKY